MNRPTVTAKVYITETPEGKRITSSLLVSSKAIKTEWLTNLHDSIEKWCDPDVPIDEAYFLDLSPMFNFELSGNARPVVQYWQITSVKKAE